MRGALAIVAVYWIGLSTAIASPSDADLRIVSQHEPVRAWLDRFAPDPYVPADQAVDDAVRQVAQGRALEHDSVLDLRILDVDLVADRREGSHVGVDAARATADDRRAANDRPFDDGALLDDDLPLDTALGVYLSLDLPLERLENQPVRLEHVLELARVFPPALHDVRADGQAAVDQVLDRVGDLELVPEARFDAIDRLKHVRAEHVDADEREVADRLLRFFDEAHDLAVLQLRDAEHLRIGDVRQQDLRRRLLRLELAHELRDPLVQQVVAEIHHERLVADVVAADLHRMREPARRILLDVLHLHAPARSVADRGANLRLRVADDDADVRDAGVGDRLDAVEEDRLVGHRYQLFRAGVGERPQTRPSAAAENQSFHVSAVSCRMPRRNSRTCRGPRARTRC